MHDTDSLYTKDEPYVLGINRNFDVMPFEDITKVRIYSSDKYINLIGNYDIGNNYNTNIPIRSVKLPPNL